MKVAGYGWTWDVPVNRWGTEISIKRGAFRESIKAAKGQPVRLLWVHDEQQVPIGVVTKLEEDDIGLRFEADLLDTQLARDVFAAMQAGAIHAPSISFDVEASEYKVDEKASTMQFTRIPLREISAVNFPAHPAASMWIVAENNTEPAPTAGAQE